MLVSDQDKALDFYTNVLGLEQRAENPTADGSRFLTVGVKGRLPAGSLARNTGAGPAGQGPNPGLGDDQTEDCRKSFEELKAHGVEFETDVLEFPCGYVALFQDPDGNRLQIREGR